MGIPVLILGESGSGKSTSLRNFEPREIGIFNIAGKPLPFRKQLPKVDRPSYEKIKSVLKRGKLKTYVIDDSQYLLAFEFFNRALETGYTKFTQLAINFKNLIDFIITDTPPDCIVYFLHHVAIAADGIIKAKTIGKMLDDQLTVEGLFSIVLLCRAQNDKHYFQTQSEGISVAKSPMEMLPAEMDNDLKEVDTAIREYWGLTSTENKEELDGERN